MLEFKYIKNKYWQTFILSFLLAALLFLPISLRDAMQGYVFHYAGDYNNQSMMFWQYANQFVKDGGTFSWETDIGSSFVNSYSFPVLGSPLFWASSWIPSKWMPWAMVPLLSLSNYNLVLGHSSESFFSSLVSPGIFSFYNAIGYYRDVKSIVPQAEYALRSLLSVKYLINDIEEEQSWSADASTKDTEIEISNKKDVLNLFEVNKNAENKTYEPTEWSVNWKEAGRTSECVIYENQNFIPMGFTYDYYISKDQLAEVEVGKRSNLLLKALVLTDEQIEKYGGKLQQLPETEFDKLTYSDFEKDCTDRREQTADTFETNNYGFTATTSFDTDELVFFSVPYEKNAFTATVNGEPVDVEEVDCGLMAIPVPAGEADIVVTYHTPGLKESITISIAGIIIWILYALVCYNKGKKKGTPELQEAKESTEAVE